MSLITPGGEAAFVFVFRPRKGMKADQASSYQLTLLFPKEDEAKLRKIEKAILEKAEEKWGSKAERMLEKGQLNSPIRDGDEADQEWMHGHWYITAKSQDKPEVVDIEGEDLLDDRDFYAGCKARMEIGLGVYDHAGNKGVNAYLNNIQKLEDGERKSGRKRAAEVFGTKKDDDDERPARRRSRDEDDEDERPARRRSRDEDDDERPSRSSRRSRDDDDEDERSARRRSRDDDDEDERPARRNRSRDDDDDERPARRRSRDD